MNNQEQQQKKRTYSKRNYETVSDSLGKVPPHNKELEEMILGALMMEKEAINNTELVPDDFYVPAHQSIFQAILNLKNAHRPIDMLTVTEELKSMKKLEEAGGPYFITLLTAKVNSAAHLEYHSMIVKQKSIARKLIHHSSMVSAMSFDESLDIADVIEFMEKSFTDITAGHIDAEFFEMMESIDHTLKYLTEIQVKHNNNESTLIPTGLNALDKQLNGGWNAPDLIIIGGRPSMGKTQFAVHFAKNAGSSDNDCLFISIEMTKIQLIMRMLTENEGISFYNMKTGQLSPIEWELIQKRIAELLKMKITIADDHKIRYLNNIKSLARRLHRQGKLKIMIIDYLQLIKTNMQFQTRDLEVGFITGELKNLAKELNIPIIVLAQLNRPQKGHAVRKPELEDLRESGNIEQDADIVIFPHRPSYYNEDAVDDRNVSWRNRGVLYMGKHREGLKDDKVIFRHDERFKKIWDDGELDFGNISSDGFDTYQNPF